MTSAAEFTGTVAGDAVDTASITGAAAAAANGAAAAENSICKQHCAKYNMHFIIIFCS